MFMHLEGKQSLTHNTQAINIYSLTLRLAQDIASLLYIFRMVEKKKTEFRFARINRKCFHNMFLWF